MFFFLIFDIYFVAEKTSPKKKPIVFDEESDEELDPIAHKKSLKDLKMTDPEFFKFLESNDRKLLDFNLEDIDADEDPHADPPELSDTEKDSDGDSDDSSKHVPKNKLDVASDESDFEVLSKDNKYILILTCVLFALISVVQYYFSTNK